MRTTRLAPSPTGALHLGNARTFLLNWLLARQERWWIILRIEDIDGPRIKRGADRQAMADLAWLGIDWDEGPVYQSSRLEHYAVAAKRLVEAKEAYPCICTRSDVERAASAPHAEDGAAVYPGTCRGRFRSIEEATHAGGRAPAIRFAVGDDSVEFQDEFAGRQRVETEALGDFVIVKADVTPAYQLAVVVDDAEMGVTDVVRGQDLLDSAARQILLYRAMGWEARIPRYWHLPLVVGTDGRRLAKRHGDTRISSYRERGASAGEVLRLLASWSGIDVPDRLSTAGELVGRLDLTKVPRGPIEFDPGAFTIGGG